MTKRARPPLGLSRSAAALTESLKRKSGRRRKQQTSLSAIERHAPQRRNDLLPKLDISYVPLSDLQQGRRLRRRDAAQVERISSSIAKFGVCQPVLVDAENRIVHGHSIREAAGRLGLTKIPVIAIDHLTRDEQRLLSIALNRLAETGSWDEEALQVEILELIELGEDPVVTGFEAAEIDLILLDEEGELGDPEEKLPPLATSATSRARDLWCLGPHRLLHGDALDPESYTRLFGEDEAARLILTDPPYNVAIAGHVTRQKRHREFAMATGEMSREEFGAFHTRWMGASASHLVDGGLLATFMDWRSVELVLTCGRELDLSLLNLPVWVKSNGGQGSLWRSQHELIPVFKKGQAPHLNNVQLGRRGRWRSNVWPYAGASSLGSDAREGLSDHPTVKPRALLEDALLDVSRRDEIVLDPFAGSGSTLVAAEAVGRVCRAIEIDGLYCDLIIRRWQAMTGTEARLAETGETFAAVASRRESDASQGDL